MSTLIRCFETFSEREFKDLATQSPENEAEDEADENADHEWACIRSLYILHAFVQSCGEVITTISKDVMKELAQNVLMPIGSAYQQLADEQCGEAIFNFLLQCIAALCPLYGILGESAEQARVAYFICNATLPSIKPQEALKRAADMIFDSRNLAAIEALCELCKGNGLHVITVIGITEWSPYGNCLHFIFLSIRLRK